MRSKSASLIALFDRAERHGRGCHHNGCRSLSKAQIELEDQGGDDIRRLLPQFYRRSRFPDTGGVSSLKANHVILHVVGHRTAQPVRHIRRRLVFVDRVPVRGDYGRVGLWYARCTLCTK